MELTLKLPDLKFAVGDIVEVANEHNDRSIKVKIVNFSMDGTWWYGGLKRREFGKLLSLQADMSVRWNGSNSPGAEGLCSYYHTEVLPDSWCDTEPPLTVLREGDMVFNVGMLERRGNIKGA